MLICLRVCVARKSESSRSSCVACSLRSRSRTFVTPAAANEPTCSAVALTEERDCSDECSAAVCGLGEWEVAAGAAGQCSVSCHGELLAESVPRQSMRLIACSKARLGNSGSETSITFQTSRPAKTREKV